MLRWCQVWFQNRRAKYRKQEKQLAKSLAPSAAACNGMMRSMYQHHHAAGRAYPYSACTARYAPHQFMNSAAAAAAAGYTQFSAGMPGSVQGMYAATGSNMSGMAATTAHAQQSTQRLPMAADYGLSLVSHRLQCCVELLYTVEHLFYHDFISINFVFLCVFRPVA